MEILQITPPRCDGRVPGVSEAIAEIKIDGHRGLAHFGCELGRAHLTGRRISKVTGNFTERGLNIPHITRLNNLWWKAWNKKYTVLDGEVVVPGYPFEAVQSVMGSKPIRAFEWQKENAFAQYVVFDVLFSDGIDVRSLPRSERRILASDIVRDMQRFTNKVEFIQSKKVLTLEQRQEFFDEVVADGGEGLVIKTIDGRYGVGQLKMKEVKTFDVVITGFTDANYGKTGKYDGLIGAVEFGAYRNGELVYIGRCSGMDDTQRIDFSKRSDWYVGKVVEVKSNGLTKRKVLRHPQFLRLRDDKAPEECVI